MSVKDFLPIDGFDIAKDIHVRCKNCRRLHTFEKEECGSDTWSEEADMGTRTEYTFMFDGQCKRCGNHLSCTVRVSEYPSGTMEGAPSIECRGCEEIDFGYNSVGYCNYETYIDSSEINQIIQTRPQQAGHNLDLVLDNGQAIVVGNERLYHHGHIKVEIPSKRQLADILVVKPEQFGLMKMALHLLRL